MNEREIIGMDVNISMQESVEAKMSAKKEQIIDNFYRYMDIRCERQRKRQQQKKNFVMAEKRI